MHPVNKLLFISFIDVGIVTLRSDIHEAKVSFPIDFIENRVDESFLSDSIKDENDNSCNDKHEENDSFPIDSIEDGISILINDLHKQKVPSKIDVNDDGIISIKVITLFFIQFFFREKLMNMEFFYF